MSVLSSDGDLHTLRTFFRNQDTQLICIMQHTHVYKPRFDLKHTSIFLDERKWQASLTKRLICIQRNK